jgi:hypothetical protein
METFLPLSQKLYRGVAVIEELRHTLINPVKTKCALYKDSVRTAQ